MKNTLTLVTLLATFAIYSQTTYTCADSYCAVAANAVGSTDYGLYFAASRARNFPLTNTNKEVLKGFKSANISINGTSKVYLSRYNPISNEVEIKGDDNKIYNLRKVNNVLVNFNNSAETYKAVSYKNVYGQEVVDYFLIPSSNGTLLKQIAYTYVKPRAARTGYDKAKPAYYKEKVRYYFVDNNQNLVALTTNKKNVKSYYSVFSEDILAFIKNNRIKDNKENDLLKLATYMQVLQSKAMKNKALASNEK